MKGREKCDFDLKSSRKEASSSLFADLDGKRLRRIGLQTERMLRMMLA